MILGTLFLTASNFFLVWIPVYIRRTMDQVEALGEEGFDVPSSIVQTLFSTEASKILATNSLILIGTVALYGILLFATRQTLIVTSRRVEFDIRNDIVKKLMNLPQRYYAENSSGETYVRATEDVSKVRDYYGPVIMYSINTITRAGFVLTMMFIVNPELTLWALIPLPLISFFAYWITGYIHTHSTIIQEQYSTLAGRAKETFSAIRLIQSYNRTDHEQKLFEEESEQYRKKKLRLDAIESMFHPALNFLIGLSLIIVIWKGGGMVIEGTLTVGNIAEFLIYVAYLIWPVAALGYTTNRFQRSLASWNRIEELMNEPNYIEDDEHSVDGEINGDIEFKNVSFSYPGSDEKVLENISFKIKSGENIAIVGRTGSGKTTLVQLIPRLFDPVEGKILLDGEDLKKWKLEAIRDAVGFVPQETFLFSDTIGDNIAFGVNEADEKQIEHAAEKAQVKENILEFEKKFKTMLGERGITLSGGQKQRTAIARALIKDPRILVFDDSLSAVDTKTEEAILKHLRQELSGRTTIMISHRISTIKDADKIYYIEEGRIVESGTHEQLLAENGRYSAMHNKQLLEEELAEI
ncbi:ABC transporter ATP-binding protein [Gracilimonas mengyeensis]|uniref:ATP-binding cassette, subfamily B n=1 Tax=Gracilimonas mengyeensis TaxID=1302730 RepID=A0A521AZK6_9BACT|nr:ABC transporter ATP-binding protein [Gracilimonas mengyeensis]SMO40219.1 ATP-binding cassette, subfamily B [Gracilimonas mengyeensis]